MSIATVNMAAKGRESRAFGRFEWLLALRYLRSKRRETFISVISGFAFVGIMLGVMALIVVMSVMNGFRKEITSKILGATGHVLVQPAEYPLNDYVEVAKRLEGVPGVSLAVPFVDGRVLASTASGAEGVLVRGLRERDLTRLPVVAGNVLEGDLKGFDQSKGVAIGSRLAARLGLMKGDRITLVSPRGAVTVMGTAPRIKAYPVAAIFELGMAEYDAQLVLMPFAEAQGFFNLPEQAGAIEIYVEDPEQVGALRPALEAAGGRPLLMQDWRQRNASYLGVLQVERNVMFIILTLIILVASLNIVSGLTMLVKDKSRDIAILRTMGASRGSVLRIFFITGSSIAVIGTVAGVVLAMLICTNIDAIKGFFSWVMQTELFPAEFYFLSKLPAEMDAHEVAAVVLMSLGLSFLATLYPAWRAARLDPVEALRYE